MEETHVLSALSALAQEARLRAFRLLVAAGPEGLPAGQIAEELGIPSNTLSFHLSHLRAAGLIEGRRAGRSQIYNANYAAMAALVGYLSDNCCSRCP